MPLLEGNDYNLVAFSPDLHRTRELMGCPYDFHGTNAILVCLPNLYECLMKYLKQFNQRLKKMRETRRLSHQDIAAFCLVDPSVVESWEADRSELRCYPTLDNLLDLCFKTGSALESFIDIPTPPVAKQLGLPGINLGDESDLADTLSELDDQIARVMPAGDENELLRRFRKSDTQTKELILQLIAS